MARISDFSDSPFNGVSQAPETARLRTHSAISINNIGDISLGCEKRPPWEFMGNLAGHPGSTSGVAHLTPTKHGNFLLTLTKEAGVVVPRVYSLALEPLGYSPAGIANEMGTVSADAHAYLNASLTDANADFQLLTVEDYTFALNRQVTVDITRSAGVPVVVASRPREAMLWVRQAAYGRKYVATVSPTAGAPVTAALTTPSGKEASDGNYVDTAVIAGSLVSGGYPSASDGDSITAASDGASSSGNLAALTGQGYTVTRYGSVIYISHPTKDFTVDVQDGQGGEAFTVIKDRVQTISDLPKRAVAGFVVRIGQSTGITSDDFFMTYSQTAGSAEGIWQESIGPGAQVGLEPKTMPFGFAYDPLGTGWTCAVLPWKARTTGDQFLVPDQGWVGEKLRDITFWKNRLGILSTEFLTLSSADDPFKLYPTTLSTVLASDAVSYVNPFDERGDFSYAIPFKQKLLLIGPLRQAQVTVTGDTLTAGTSDIDEFSGFEVVGSARPQTVNNRLYVQNPLGLKFSGVAEVDITRTTGNIEGEPLSVHVPHYLPAGVDRVATCKARYQTAYGVSGQSIIYIHTYRFVEQQRAQNEWEQWTIPDGYTLGGLFFINTYLHAVICKGSSARLVRADLSPAGLDDGAGATILTKLDLRVTEDGVTRVYDADADQTLITLSYPVDGDEVIAVRAPAGLAGPSYTEEGPLQAYEGQLGEVVEYAGSTLLVSGDWTQTPFYVGRPYIQQIRLSRFFARDPKDRPLQDARLSIRAMVFTLSESAYAKVRVSQGAREPKEYTLSGPTADDGQSTYDSLPLFSGGWRLGKGIKCDSRSLIVDFIGDSHLSARFTGISWEGEMNQRALRTGS